MLIVFFILTVFQNRQVQVFRAIEKRINDFFKYSTIKTKKELNRLAIRKILTSGQIYPVVLGECSKVNLLCC